MTDAEEKLRRAADRLRGDDVSTWRGVRLLSHLAGDREVRRILDDSPDLEEELLELLRDAAEAGGEIGRMAEDVERSLGDAPDPNDGDDAGDPEAPEGVVELLDMVDAGELEVDDVTLELLVSRTRDAGAESVTGEARTRLVEILEEAEHALSPDGVELLTDLRGDTDPGAGEGTEDVSADAASRDPGPDGPGTGGEPARGGGLDALLTMRDFGSHAEKLPLDGIVAVERGRGSDAERFLSQLVYVPLLESRSVLVVEPEGTRLTALDSLPKMEEFRDKGLFRSVPLPGDADEIARAVERELAEMGDAGVHPATFVRLPADDWGKRDLGEIATGLEGLTDLFLVLEGGWSEADALSVDGPRIVIEEGGGEVVAVAQPRKEGQPPVRYRYGERDGVLMPVGKELAELEETRCVDCGTAVVDDGGESRCEDCEKGESPTGEAPEQGDVEEDAGDEWEGRLI